MSTRKGKKILTVADFLTPEAEPTKPIDAQARLASSFMEFDIDRERLLRCEADLCFRYKDEALVVYAIWDLPETPHLKLSKLAKIEKAVAARVSLRFEANSMHLLWMDADRKAYREGARAYFAGLISSEDLGQIGTRLSTAEREQICIEESPLGAAC